jgi:hypothetical protein
VRDRINADLKVQRAVQGHGPAEKSAGVAARKVADDAAWKINEALRRATSAHAYKA